MSLKTKVNYAECTMFVVGLDMDCPLCGVKVKSGESHQCASKPEPRKVKPKRKARVSQ